MLKLMSSFLWVLICVLGFSISTAYFVGFDQGTMDAHLKQQKYVALQQDIYSKYETKAPEDLAFLHEWIRHKIKETGDVLMLYFALREGYYGSIASNVALSSDQVKETYKFLMLFFIRVFMDVCACKAMGDEFAADAIWTYEFLRTKIIELWSPSIFNYECSFKEVLNGANGAREILQRTNVIKRLPSPAWACCSQRSKLAYVGFWKNTIYFGEADEAMRNLFDQNKEKINMAYSESIAKILSVLSHLDSEKNQDNWRRFLGSDFNTLFAGEAIK